MSTLKELTTQLRKSSRHFRHEAADLLEALEGEVARFRDALGRQTAEFKRTTEALEGEKQGWVEAEAQYLADVAVLVARTERLREALRLYEKAEKVGTSDAYEVAHNVRKIELEDDKQ